MQNKIREFRAKEKMSQEALALEANVSRQTISNIEHGSVPSLDVAQRIAKVFDAKVDDIFLSNLSYVTYKNKSKA
ncbi:helix-turn-helix transcriptional regulator [Pediococcus stilesii]|uniref:Helix-turn-helix transcriptional regulator n=1 Tax=Pediococcus stilesii TaxID=331679 RepID=A0A5R9BXN5_9LACO|nr:helix-turn-helix transcriptional regulator [Pediococcus stilesii]TLQ05439.1 helix-turn-helix transcriptional regulator [Pediococcus stilesii]